MEFLRNLRARLIAWRLARENGRTRKALADLLDDLQADGKPFAIITAYPQLPDAGILWMDGKHPAHVRMALLSFDQGALVAPIRPIPAPEMRQAIGRAVLGLNRS